jgi:CRISPR type IV-associated protein Csf2
MSNLHNIRLDGTVTLLSPLSHIGESIGPDSFLSQDIIVGPDGRATEVFVYSGNAYRGLLRDLSAIYMTEKLGNIQYPFEVFYLLFAGGALGGPQSIDIDQARMYRRNVPHLSVFGGGVGNQILNGKIKVGSMYPLVAECQRVLPESLRDPDAPSWRQWTFEKSFTRMDDAKREDLRQYLAGSEMDGLLAAPKQQQLIAGPDEPQAEKQKKKKEDPPQQMRYTVEMLAAGAIMYQRIDLIDMTDLEIGAFVSALDQFSKNPYIGGKSGTGHGLVEVEYSWRPAGARESSGMFAWVGMDYLHLSAEAKEAKEKYDYFLNQIYNQYLEENNSELRQLLAAGGSK